MYDHSSLSSLRYNKWQKLEGKSPGFLLGNVDDYNEYFGRKIGN